jgi:NAD(P)H-dependent flavin oxidoreductase YrpB (nitropropane dioxygenase family)
VSLLERLCIAVPVIGGGMGGGLSTAPLAIAMGRAGGMGQIGFAAPAQMRTQMAAHRAATGAGPLAVNLLLPFARRAHWLAADDADAVVTFWGMPRRLTERVWIHQCGSVEEAEAAVTAGADGVIAQGIEAGGHVRGTTPALELTERIRAALGASCPVWTAGGVAERVDVENALAAGAEAVVVGTRFLMAEESGAHPAYQQKLVQAQGTILTELFGAGWPAAHRVVANEATRRWLGADPRGPGWLRLLHRVSAPVLSRTPPGLAQQAVRFQRPWMPLLMPVAPTSAHPASAVDSAPLYAGQGISRITDVRPAADIVGELAGR